MPFQPDPKSVASAELALAEQVDVLVIGAGAAGMAAARQAVAEGRSVMLVDENPISAETMAENVPLHFGGGMTGAVRNRNAMLEAVTTAMPALEAALEEGVDVRLGTACWGIYTPGPDIGWLHGPVAGLMDGARSWMVGADRIVVAAGGRDMGLAFPGWEKDGVMGLAAAQRLARLYDALLPRRVVVLGTSADTLRGARDLQAKGCQVLAVVDPASVARGPAALIAELEAGGTQVLLGYAPARAEGQAAVEALVLRPVTPDGQPGEGAQIQLDCDGVLLGVGAVPVVELLDAAGCRMGFDAARGGIVPILDDRQMTTRPGIYAAGDCAGIWPDKSADPAIAKEEGCRAVMAEPGCIVQPPSASSDLAEERMAWVRATLLDSGDACHVCQCEEVTARDILEVRPPRYLNAETPAGEALRPNRRDLRGLLGDRPHPDQVKRLTRASMGPCQGRRCREQVAALLALGSGQDYGAVRPASHRAPVRPIPVALAAQAVAETPAMAAHWDTWFGMPAQYIPFWSVPDEYTAASRPRQSNEASE